MIVAHFNHCRAVMTHLVLFSRMRTRCKEHIEVWRFCDPTHLNAPPSLALGNPLIADVYGHYLTSPQRICCLVTPTFLDLGIELINRGEPYLF